MRRANMSFIIISIMALLLNSTYVAAQTSESVEITLPDYRVTTVGNLDYVEIPQGDTLAAEEGRPMVPYYIEYIEYPKGHRVQDVILKERSGLRTTTGLNLPVVILDSDPELPVEMKTGWYPEEEYNWMLWNNSDGSTFLVITMYPFYYYPETTNVKFYKNYSFDIEYVVSTVTITSLTPVEDFYQPGDRVPIDIRLNNSDEAQDVIVSMMIKGYGTDEIVSSLPPRALADLAGDASLTMEWDTGGIQPGYYYAEVGLADTEGSTLDNKRAAISLMAEKLELQPLSWDINEDARVDYRDLAILGAHYWEITSPPYPRYDINQDGTIDIYDHDLLMAHYEEIAQ